jgi:hypothetical protein
MPRPDDLVSVYSTSDANEAEILRAALHDEGVKCEISGESQAGLAGISTMGIELLVRAEDYDRARDFLAKHRRGD